MGLTAYFTRVTDIETSGLKLSVVNTVNMSFGTYASIFWNSVLIGMGCEGIWREVKVLRTGC